MVETVIVVPIFDVVPQVVTVNLRKGANRYQITLNEKEPKTCLI